MSIPTMPRSYNLFKQVKFFLWVFLGFSMIWLFYATASVQRQDQLIFALVIAVAVELGAVIFVVWKQSSVRTEFLNKQYQHHMALFSEASDPLRQLGELYQEIISEKRQLSEEDAKYTYSTLKQIKDFFEARQQTLEALSVLQLIEKIPQQGSDSLMLKNFSRDIARQLALLAITLTESSANYDKIKLMYDA